MTSFPASAVLLVDDNPSNLKVLSEALAGQPFSLTVAIDGEMALEQIRQAPPDLVLLDAMMPGMDGFEVCRRVKADPDTAEIPIIFMTSLGDTADRVRGFEAGAVDYVTKPFEREELLARVKTQIALRTAARSLTEKNAELEREIAERTSAQAALSRAVQDLKQAQTAIFEAADRAAQELRRGRDALEVEVSRRTEELRDAKERLELELTERKRAEAERAALQEQIIAAQAARLAELSTPIIPISDTILVVPLIGFIDEERAARVREAALRRATESHAEVMILDVTGVPRADAGVAEGVLATARALRLVGTRTLLTGIQPEVAQALIALGVDLTEVVTLSTLQSGIAHAMRGPSDVSKAAHPSEARESQRGLGSRSLTAQFGC